MAEAQEIKSTKYNHKSWDYVDKLRTNQREYNEIIEKLLIIDPTLCDLVHENYTDSYKWLRLPAPDDYPGMVSDLILSDLELLPNDCLSGILLEGLKNGLPSEVHLSGIGIDRIQNSFCFYISGSTSLEVLQNLCEQYKLNRDELGKKKSEK